jgi:hypothetical protein
LSALLARRRELAAALFAVAVAATAIEPVRTSVLALFQAVRHGGETYDEARRRSLPGYAEGIDEIRRRIPEDGEYLLAEGADTSGFFFVQYDLAPRRAWNLGAWYVAARTLHARGKPAGAPAWVVISLGTDRAPLLVETDVFFAGRAP